MNIPPVVYNSLAHSYLFPLILVFNAAISALGLPCITLPLLGIDGMPTGIQLMGQHHTDWNLTGYASWMMQTLKPISA